MTGSGAQKKLLTIIGTAATATIIGTLAVLLGVLDGTALQAALIFGAAGAIGGLVVVALKPRAGQK